jgi:H+/Cl- antiporter ClcA
MHSPAILISLVLLFGLVGLNAYASVLIARDKTKQPGQRIAQTVFVWLIPILGALLVVHLMRSVAPSSRPSMPDSSGDYDFNGDYGTVLDSSQSSVEASVE